MLIATSALAVLPCAGAGVGTNSGRYGAAQTASSLLCAGLLGSGTLDSVLTLAPVTMTATTDPRTAIQFSRIWSDTHQATVGGGATDGGPADGEQGYGGQADVGQAYGAQAYGGQAAGGQAYGSGASGGQAAGGQAYGGGAYGGGASGSRVPAGSQMSVGGNAPVGGDARVAASQMKAVVATVKLPIAFSASDRRRFEVAGWKPVAEPADHRTTYCLANAGRRDQGTSSTGRGMICVVAAGEDDRR